MDTVFVGVWIDHQRAYVVEVSDGREPTCVTIESQAERRRRSTGQSGVPLPGHLGGNTESRDWNRRTGQFARYFDRVIHSLPECAGLVIMGPGLAKRDLWKRIREKEPRTWEPCVLAVQTAPKLTIPQVAARVREVAASRFDPAVFSPTGAVRWERRIPLERSRSSPSRHGGPEYPCASDERAAHEMNRGL